MTVLVTILVAVFVVAVLYAATTPGIPTPRHVPAAWPRRDEPPRKP